jgi:hypothetical protein
VVLLCGGTVQAATPAWTLIHRQAQLSALRRRAAVPAAAGSASLGVATIEGRTRTLTREVTRVEPNRFRKEYFELRLRGAKGWWLFRDDQHAGALRTQRELAYSHTSAELGLGAVPRLVAGSWQGRKGSLQRVVEHAKRSSGSLKGDIREVLAYATSTSPEVDWDSLHAVAIQHYVTDMHDDAPYNLLITRSASGQLRYDAIDGERAFGHTGGFQRMGWARRLVQESIALGGPKQLSPGLSAKLRDTNVARWRQRLADSGISEAEIVRAEAKLRTLQERGLAALLE